MKNVDNEGVIYTRVSTNGQVKHGESLESQKYSCQRFADERNIKILGVFEDPGVSGKTLYRPGLSKLERFLETRKMKSTWVIVDDIDRFARLGVHKYHFLKDKIIRLGGKFLSLKDDLESETPQSKLLENIKVSIAEYEREHNQERVNSRMRARLNEGFWVFHPPPGYLLKNKLLIPDPHNKPLIQGLFQEFSYELGPSLKELKESQSFKKLLNPKTQKAYLQRPETLRKILTNKLYLGEIEFLDWGISSVNGRHEPIINPDLFEKVQNRLSSNKQRSHRRINMKEFPLKGDVICGKCKTKLVASFSKGRSAYYPYYRCKTSLSKCDTKPKNLSRDNLHNQFLELLDNAKIDKKILKMAEKIIEDTFEEKSNQLNGIQSNNKRLIESLERKRKRQVKKILAISNESVLKQLDEEINSIDKEIKLLSKELDQDNSLKDFKLSSNLFFTDPKQFWLKGTTEEKKILFNFVFDKEVEIVNGKVGTAPYSIPYRLLGSPVTKKENMVELSGIEPLTSTLPVLRSPS